MNFNEPKNTNKIYWTKHSIQKMKFYGLTPQRVLRIIKNPERREVAIVEKCVACMQSIGTKKKTEVWVMYQIRKQEAGGGMLEKNLLSKNQKKIISVWRYPGVSPKNKMPIIPEDVLNQINK